MTGTPALAKNGASLAVFLLFAVGCFGSTALANQASPSEEEPIAVLWSVTSPDTTLALQVRHTVSEGLEYRVVRNEERSVLGWSSLGIQTSEIRTALQMEPIIADFRSSITFTGSKQSTVNDDYVMKTGKRRLNHARANQLSLSFKDDETEKHLRLDIRVFNEGFGFRYALPDESNLMVWLSDETSSFNVGEGGKHWGQPYDFAGVYTPAYETPFLNGVSSGTSTDDSLGTGWGFPSLFETRSGDWLLLHESNVGISDHGVHLQADATAGIYRIAFPLQKSGMGFGRNFAAATQPWNMPWRIGIVSSDLAGIVESNLVFHFSEPSRIENTDWIKPGLSSWSWWSDHASSRDLDALKEFVDLSAQMGWPYSLIDANWNTISDTAMEDLTNYARKRGVGLFFWYNSGGRHNFVTEQPRNIMSDPRRRRAEFAKLRRLGAKGVKVDFFQSDKQDVMNLYLDILEDAAAEEIMVLFHGSTIPRGWARTWPNLMTMESVRGAEVYTFQSTPDYGKLATYHNAILPFTRNVVGSMDYTPVSYSQQLIKRRTSNAHETALAVLFESGIQHIADSAQSLLALPKSYKQFFRTLPAAWDETKFVAGYPGRDVVIARRSENRWYIAGINGEDKAKLMTLDLSFAASRPVLGLFLFDGGRENAFDSASRKMDNPESVTVEVGRFGGFVIVVDQQ